MVRPSSTVEGIYPGIRRSFDFVGNQVHLEVGGKDYDLDLLFSYLHLLAWEGGQTLIIDYFTFC